MPLAEAQWHFASVLCSLLSRNKMPRVTCCTYTIHFTVQLPYATHSPTCSSVESFVNKRYLCFHFSLCQLSKSITYSARQGIWKFLVLNIWVVQCICLIFPSPEVNLNFFFKFLHDLEPGRMWLFLKR